MENLIPLLFTRVSARMEIAISLSFSSLCDSNSSHGRGAKPSHINDAIQRDG